MNQGNGAPLTGQATQASPRTAKASRPFGEYPSRGLRVGTHPITPEIFAAGVAAMRGSFKKAHVAQAMERAGLPYADDTQTWGCHYVADRAADRLLQMAKKAGAVRAIDNKNWLAIAIDTRQGGDAQQAPSRSDESAAIAQPQPPHSGE